MPDLLESIAINNSAGLIEKSIKGDQQAFGKLVGLWFKKIYNFSLRYFSDHDLAMETAQQTFISAYQGIHKLKDAGSFRYWLYRIALNHCRIEDRKRKRRKWYSLFDFAEPDQFDNFITQPEQDFDAGDYAEIMARYLSMLPAEQKVVVIMKEYEGMKFREIAEALNLSENTVKSRMYYALETLRKKMERSELKN